jgi:hypothetical protein
MARPRVIAVILPARGGEANPTVEALARQTRPADRVVVAGPGDPLPVDSESGAPWLWLLDRGVVPEPRALETLLDAAERIAASSEPVLLASKLVTPGRTLDPTSVPVAEVHTPVRLLSALEHRVAALRLARSGSLLVRGDALREAGVVSATSAVERDLEWTARLLGRELGVLVPASVVVRPPAAARPRARPAARLASVARLLAGLEGRERAWFAVHLCERALASSRARVRG